MAAPVQTGMDKAEMKKLLVKSKKEPVNCAIGVGDNNAFGLLMLDRIKAPKAVEKELVKEIPAAKNTRWGTAMVDPDDDPKLVKIFLNKPISSMAKRLVKTLKGTGFTKVQILLEDGTAVEGAEEEDETLTAAGDGASAPAAAPSAREGVPPPPPPPAAEKPAQDAAALTRRLAELAARIPQAAAGNAARQAELAKLATQANVNIKTNNLTYAAVSIEQLSKALDAAPPPPPPPPPQPAAPAQDAAALAKALAELAPRIPQVAGDDAARRAELMKLATDANVNIKTNNLTYAATYIAQLRKALDSGAAAAPASARGEAPASAGPDDAKQKARDAAFAAGTYGKSGAIWIATRTKVESEIEKLRAAIVGAYQGQPFVGEIEAKFREKTAPIMQTLDTRLSDTLAEIGKENDAAKRSQLIDQAHAVVDEYRAYAADGLLADLDANPFAPVTVQATINGTLAQLDKALA